MPKVWQPGDAKKFSKQVELGKTYYYINTHALNLGAYEDPQTYSKIVFDARSPITGTPLSSSISAVGLCQRFGPVYDTPPRGLRDIASEPSQVGAPLGHDYRAYLDEPELRGLDKRTRDASSPHGRRI